MNDQATLPLFKEGKSDIADDVHKLSAYLACRGWRTAKEISSVVGFNDRYTRELAEHSNGSILGSGLGYKLTREATPTEMNEWEARYTSQINRMNARRVKTLKAWHQRSEAKL